MKVPAGSVGGSNVSVDRMGAFSYFCNNCNIQNVKSIGRFCSISSDCNIGLPEHTIELLSTSSILVGKSESNFYYSFLDGFCKNSEWVDKNIKFARKREKKQEIVIGNDVWIGHGATILNGVTIGDGAVIGASALVTKDVAPYSIVGGVPARVIRKRFPDEIIERLLRLQWWEYDPNVLLVGISQEITEAVGQLENRITEMEKWEPEYVCFDYFHKEIYLKDKLQQKRLYRI